jgi:hypothetical protein
MENDRRGRHRSRDLQAQPTEERNGDTPLGCSGVVWRNRPMREVIKFSNLKECDCRTVAEGCRVLPPPFPLSSLRVLLGYAVTIGSLPSNASSYTLHYQIFYHLSSTTHLNNQN